MQYLYDTRLTQVLCILTNDRDQNLLFLHLNKFFVTNGKKENKERKAAQKHTTHKIQAAD